MDVIGNRKHLELVRVEFTKTDPMGTYVMG